MGSSMAETSRVTSSASLPSAYGDTAGPLIFTLQKTAEKEQTSPNKYISVQASSKKSKEEKSADYNATRSGKIQSRDSVLTDKKTSNSSTSVALDLIKSNDKLPDAVSTSIAADHMTVLLGSLSVLPSKLTNFRKPSPSVDSGFTSKDLYSTSSVVPVWTANMLGNAYGGGYVVTPSIFVTSFPDSPSSSGIPPGYELSSKSEDFQSSRSPTRVSMGAGGLLALVPGLSKDEATLGVSTSASTLDALRKNYTSAASFTQISLGASSHDFLKPVSGTKLSLASIIPIKKTDRLNTSLLISLVSASLAGSPLISSLVNQSVIGAYIPTSVPELQGLAFKKTVDYGLGLFCITVLFLFL